MMHLDNLGRVYADDLPQRRMSDRKPITWSGRNFADLLVDISAFLACRA